MEIGSGPSAAPPEAAQPDFIVSFLGLVSRTFTLWSRRLHQYVILLALGAIAFVGIQAIFFVALFGPIGLILIGVATADTLDLLVELLTGVGLTPFLALVLVLVTIVGMLLYGIVGGAAAKLALDNYGAPERGEIGSSLSFALSRLPTLIGASMLSGLALMGLVLLAILAALALGLVGFIGGFILFFYLAVRLSPVLGVVIGENLSAYQSVVRAYSITNRCFWHIFGGKILLTILLIIIRYVLGIVLLPVLILTNLWVFALWTLIMSSLLDPIGYIFQAVLYRDLVSRISVSQGEVWQ